MSTKFGIGGLLGERLLDCAALFVAALFSSLNVTLKGIAVLKARVQALARQNSDFDLGHVQPTGVLGRVVESDPAQQLGGAYNSSRWYMRGRYSWVSAAMHYISLRQGLMQFFLVAGERSRG